MFEKIKAFFSGKKTYGLVGLGIIFNLLAKKGWLPAGMTEEHFIEFINTILTFASIGTARQAITKVSTPAGK